MIVFKFNTGRQQKLRKRFVKFNIRPMPSADHRLSEGLHYNAFLF